MSGYRLPNMGVSAKGLRRARRIKTISRDAQTRGEGGERYKVSMSKRRVLKITAYYHFSERSKKMTILMLKIIGIAIITTLIIVLCVMGGEEIHERIRQRRYKKKASKAEANDNRIREMILKEIYRREIEITLGNERTRYLAAMMNTEFGRERLKETLKEERERQWQSIASKKEQEPKEILLKNSHGMDIRVDGQCSIAVKPKKDKQT